MMHGENMNKAIRIFLKGGPPIRWVDMPLPTNATFLSFFGQVKFEGYAVNENVMIPFDEIACMVLLDPGKPTPLNVGLMPPLGQA